MSQISKILDSIFQNNGGTTKQWRQANEILLTRTDEVKKYVAYMKNKIRDLNKDTQLLALDFLDYSIDDGKMPLWTQVGSKDFLNSLVNIYKTRNEEEVQTKILFLIKKWANKFQKYNTIIPNFFSTYEHLKNNDVNFPKDEESTYEKYLQGPGVNSGFGSGESKKIKDENNISKNKTYVKDINVDLRTNSYEKKYKRLVNKLDDWTQQIQDANVYMDLAQGGSFDDELRGICEDLESGKKLLVDTIESGKLKDEKLMEISLNVQDDLEMTLKRWEDVKNGRNPEPFKSSFFGNKGNNNDNFNNDNKGNNNISSNINNNQNKGGFDLLGFDNDFGGGNNNTNNNNNSNQGNDLLDVFSQNSNQANQNQGNNNFFGNMGNNNQNNNQNNNNDFFGINNNQMNANQNNNNFFGNNNNQNTFSQNNNNNFFGNTNNQNNFNQNNNNNFFGNNNNQNNFNQNNNNNFFGNNNNQNNINQNQNNSNNNDLFSQMFNNSNTNNSNNNMANNNFMNNNNNSNSNNINSNNNFNNLFQSNNNFNNNNNNAFNMNNNQFINLNNNNTMNNQINLGNNNNFNNFNFNNNNFNLDKKKNDKNTSNKDYVFDFQV